MLWLLYYTSKYSFRAQLYSRSDIHARAIVLLGQSVGKVLFRSGDMLSAGK